MTPEQFALWRTKVALIEKQLARIEEGVKAILADMDCPEDPAQIYAILAGEKKAPWTSQTTERSKRRAKLSMYAVVYISKVRAHLGPLDSDVPTAADAALTLGWLTGQLGLELLTKARSKKAGSAPKTKTKRRTAQRNAKLRRDAAKLPSKLSISAKAKLLARTSKLTADRIRHIIG